MTSFWLSREDLAQVDRWARANRNAGKDGTRAEVLRDLIAGRRSQEADRKEKPAGDSLPVPERTTRRDTSAQAAA